MKPRTGSTSTVDKLQFIERTLRVRYQTNIELVRQGVLSETKAKVEMHTLEDIAADYRTLIEMGYLVDQEHPVASFRTRLMDRITEQFVQAGRKRGPKLVWDRDDEKQTKG